MAVAKSRVVRTKWGGGGSLALLVVVAAIERAVPFSSWSGLHDRHARLRTLDDTLRRTERARLAQSCCCASFESKCVQEFHKNCPAPATYDMPHVFFVGLIKIEPLELKT